MLREAEGEGRKVENLRVSKFAFYFWIPGAHSLSFSFYFPFFLHVKAEETKLQQASHGNPE